MLETFISIYLKFFFLLTPFFVLSAFLSMTVAYTEKERKKTAIKVTLSVVVISLILLVLGNHIFSIFGITLDSFRIGTGILLFLSAKKLIDGNEHAAYENKTEDISVVPLAIPVTVGPATTGALLVMGYEFSNIKTMIIGIIALISAILTVGLMLYLAGFIEKIVKKQGLNILSKITGLILAALSVQIVMVGIKGFVENFKK